MWLTLAVTTASSVSPSPLESVSKRSCDAWGLTLDQPKCRCEAIVRESWGPVNALVVMSGLPGSGKSSISRELARRLALPRIELDLIEGPVLSRGVTGDAFGWAGYEILANLARDNLGWSSLVLDSVAWTHDIRTTFENIAIHHGAVYCPIEVVVDAETLDRRLARRWGEITAADRLERIKRLITLFEPWRSPRLVLDTSEELPRLVERATEYVQARLSPS